MKIYPIFSACLFLALWGCARYKSYPWTTEIAVYDQNPASVNYSKVPADQIIVYAAEKFAPKQYVVIAKLKSNGDWMQEEDLYGELRQKASDLGADAVIMLEVTHVSTGGLLPNKDNPPNPRPAWITIPPEFAVSIYAPAPTREPTIQEQKLLQCYALAIRSRP